MNRFALTLLLATSLSACSLAPEMEPTEVSVPEHFKDTEEAKGEWKPATPLEASDRGQWWKIFADEKLNALEEEVLAANQDLKAAAARVEQARAVVRANASTILPTIDVGANAVRSKPSNASVAAFGGPAGNLKPYTLYSLGAAASYEVDIFGRVRDNESALSFDADAQEALYKNMILMLQADVASGYYQLRATDAEQKLLEETVTVRTEANRIMKKRLDVGSAGAIDYSRTEADLAAAKADLAGVERQRAVLENAMAVLLGKNPSEYRFTSPKEADFVPPLVPSGIPSTLLERRPDVSAAAASMAAANRRIGVARTAFFPKLILTVTGGLESTSLSDIFQWSSRSWALGQQAGSALAMTLFDSGRNIAGVDAAQAAYAEAIAHYRQQILVAFGDVENALSDQRLLAVQWEEAQKAAEAAGKSLRLLNRNYDEGEVAYFEVVDAQRNALAAGRAAIQARGARMIAAVNLVRALGGDWQGEVKEKIEPAAPVELTVPEAKPQPEWKAAPVGVAPKSVDEDANGVVLPEEN